MKNMKRLILIGCLLISGNKVCGTEITGIVLNAHTGKPVEFASIGIREKGIGTVSGADGRFSLPVDSAADNDSVMFSMIGYNSGIFLVSGLSGFPGIEIRLTEKVYNLSEVVVRPKIYKERTLGVTTRLKQFSAGFKDNIFGYECGILMKVKKSAYIKSVHINIAQCTYDSICFRLNVYKAAGDSEFVNILNRPIYIRMPKAQGQDGIQINLEPENIVVNGDFLVALEHIRDLGPGNLNFCASLSEQTWLRKTSLGKWKTAPVGVSISVIADVEK